MSEKSIKVVKCPECDHIASMECTQRMGSRKLICTCPECGNKIKI